MDLSRAIAGPYGSMILADLGAEVIKIESAVGDSSRTIGLSEADYKGQSYYFIAFNRNKKSIVLDLGTESGKEAFYDLVKVSDVVWDNFRAGAMERLGADYDTLKKINPRIITCSISGAGTSGPYRDRPSVDVVALAISGVMSITGEPGGPPLRPGPPLADLVAGMFGAHGVMAALYQRERTGVGQRVETNLLDGQISNLTYQISYYLYSGLVPQPMGSGHLSLVPYRAYKTKEGYVSIGPSWPRLARVLDVEWMIDDPRFKDQASRVANREAFDEIIEKALQRETAEDWLEVFYAEDIVAGPVNTIDKAIEDPQILHNKMIVSMEHPLGGQIKAVGNPIHMPDSIVDEWVAPPLLGQHNDEILKGLLNYSDEKINVLREEEERHKEALMERIYKRR